MQSSGYMGEKDFSSKPAPLHKAVKHQQNTRLTLTLTGVVFTLTHTHAYIHTNGGAVSRNTQANHPELSERSDRKRKKRERERRWSCKDSWMCLRQERITSWNIFHLLIQTQDTYTHRHTLACVFTLDTWGVEKESVCGQMAAGSSALRRHILRCYLHERKDYVC